MKGFITALLLCAAVVACSQGANLLNSLPLIWDDVLRWKNFPSLYSTFLLEPLQSLNFVVAYASQVLLYIAPVLLLWTLVKIYRFLSDPLFVVRHLGDIGYVQTREQNMRNSGEIMRKMRKIGDLPPVYPNGWYHVCFSRDVPRKQVKYVQQLGEHFAVFRGEDGVVHVLDAYCLHMGANLAVGGQVVGNCLECPFHGWRYRGSDGKCTHIPYAETPTKVPDMAKLKSWPCLERNDTIFVWYHAEGIDPTWEPDEIPQITQKQWTYRGQTVHYINCHIEEIPENGADIAHLGHLHSPFIAAGTDIRDIFQKKWKIAQHLWDATWAQMDEPNSHVGELTMAHQMGFLKWKIPYTKARLTAYQIGPGLVHLHLKTIFGDVVLIQTLTPVEPMVQRMIHTVYCSRFIPTFCAKLVLYAESLQVDRDVMIWNNKMFTSKPMFVKEDSYLVKHRRWYSQFYSEHSPKLKDLQEKNNGLNW